MTNAKYMFKSLRSKNLGKIEIDENEFTFEERLQIFNPNPGKIKIKLMNEEELELY